MLHGKPEHGLIRAQGPRPVRNQTTTDLLLAAASILADGCLQLADGHGDNCPHLVGDDALVRTNRKDLHGEKETLDNGRKRRRRPVAYQSKRLASTLVACSAFSNQGHAYMRPACKAAQRNRADARGRNTAESQPQSPRWGCRPTEVSQICHDSSLAGKDD